MGEKPNVVKEAITPPISKNNIYKNKEEKPKASNKTVDTYRRNKSEKVKSLDKSRSTQITGTESTVNTVNKPRFIPELVYLINSQNRKTHRNRYFQGKQGSF